MNDVLVNLALFSYDETLGVLKTEVDRLIADRSSEKVVE